MAIVARGCCIRVVASVSVIGAQTIAGDEQQACADMPSASSRVLDLWKRSDAAAPQFVDEQHCHRRLLHVVHRESAARADGAAASASMR